MELNRYTVKNQKVHQTVRFLFLSDLHDRPAPEALRVIAEEKPDFVAFPGDAVNRHTEQAEESLAFLEKAASLCPVFFSPGNHENYLDDLPWERLARGGVTVLDNAETAFGELRIGGLSSFLQKPEKEAAARRFAADFAREDGRFRLLLCPHPEYYPAFLRPLPTELILSGHAHGGQIRFFGQGLFAPGQGILPRYTSGLYDGRLLVSRGMANNTFVPRILNPTEMLLVTLQNGEQVI